MCLFFLRYRTLCSVTRRGRALPTIFSKNAELYNKLITDARLCLLDIRKGFHPPNRSVTLCCPAFGTRQSERYDRADANKPYR